MTVKEMIEKLDNNEELLKLKLNNLHVWPIIRFDVFNFLINEQNKLDLPAPNHKRFRFILIKNLISSLMISFIRKGRIKNYDILFFTDSHDTVRNEYGHYYNKVNEYFFDFLKDRAFMIEHSHSYKLYKREHKQIILNILILIEAKIRNAFLRKNFKEVKATYEKIKLIISQDIPWALEVLNQPQSSNKIKVLLRFNPFLRIYKDFLEFSNPKAIFINAGYYGGRFAALCYVAKMKNIVVIEQQHGSINENHISYNFGKQFLKNKDFKKYYPDYFLTYGKFWRSSIRLPNKAIDIGNPHLEEAIRNTRKMERDKKSGSILVLGSGVTVKETTMLLLTIQKHYSNHNILYRPHPMEKAIAKIRYAEALDAGILLDENDNLYQSIYQAEVVLAEVSTTLFESIAFKKNTKLFKSTYTKTYLTSSLKYLSLFDLYEVDKIFEYDPELLSKAANYYWTSNWKKAFTKFVEEIEL